MPAGVRAQVTDMATDIGSASGFEPRLRFDGAVESIHPDIAEQLLPTVREALTNVAKHANAREVTVRLAVDDFVTLTVIDDGDGVSAAPVGGHGLQNMATRAVSLGGYAELAAAPDGGSVFTWSVPSGRVDPAVG